MGSSTDVYTTQVFTEGEILQCWLNTETRDMYGEWEEEEEEEGQKEGDLS